MTRQPENRSAGIAAFSISHPVGVTMIALAILVLGGFSFKSLGTNLLPDIIYPEISVRVLDPGVPATIMEDRITRQLEEQLAITEGAIAIQSQTSEGRSAVDLTFPYGTDLDVALREASTRLDRAKRFLPDTIEPPIIFKRDPSQLPVLEIVISSEQLSAADLRDWVDYRFSRWFLNLPGVAAAEVAGAPEREIHVIPDSFKLFGSSLDFETLKTAITEANADQPSGRLTTDSIELGAQSQGRFRSVEELADLPLRTENGRTIRLSDIAEVLERHKDDRLLVRLNGTRGIKLSIQKQPQANTVDVVRHVRDRLDWLEEQKLLPDDLQIEIVGDQAIFVRNSLLSASQAAISGAILAMLVVYLFLGNLRRTLIIGSVIPVAVLVTFTIMTLSDLTLNITTLGALALGIGLLVDNTIVMLENITRHQRLTPDNPDAATEAAAEVHGAIIASTSTNLAAVLPFLFVGGLVGLLFSELIITISAAILASLVVAITLVPAYAARVTERGPSGYVLRKPMEWLQSVYLRNLGRLLKRPMIVLLAFILMLILGIYLVSQQRQVFLPEIDEGRVTLSISSDAGTRLVDMNAAVHKIEQLLQQDPRVESLFTTVGGFIFGRSEYQSSNRSSISIQLNKNASGDYGTKQWIKETQIQLEGLKLTGYKLRLRNQGIRGIRVNRGDDDLSIRVQGDSLEKLSDIGQEIVRRLEGIEGLRNIKHTYEDSRLELNIRLDRELAARMNIGTDTLALALQVAMDGVVVTEFLKGDRDMPVRLRLPRGTFTSPEQLEQVYIGRSNGRPVMLGELANISLEPQPRTIQRDQQQRIVEVSATVTAGQDLGVLFEQVNERLDGLELPEAYALYAGGAEESLKEGRNTGIMLSLLALFLVYVVMAVQYESLRNPMIILISVPFSLVGVAMGVITTDIPLSMPVWLGIIMLAGIVVNNAIVLVEQIEILRDRGRDRVESIITAAGQRLRPILMTMLTTVFGMLPLAIGFGEGAELLQPLAIVITWGLSFSLLVSLVVVPATYRLLGRA